MAKTKKRSRKKVAKEDRKNLRLWAEGARETILAPHLDAYQKAKDQGRRQERKILKKICREFHVRVGWRVKDHEEPILKEWDPTAPEDEEMLSEEEAAAKSTRVNELDARIRRWYTYRLRKLRKTQRVGKDEDPRKDPYAVLLANLSGVTAPPKALQAYQQFMKESYDEKIAPVVAERWESEKQDKTKLAERSKEPKAGFRAEVARQVFGNLPDDERKAVAERAKQQGADSKALYLRELQATPSQSPADRQRCIDAVPDFVGPILQGLHAHTGMHATLIMGGPVPMYDGELRTLHVSYGRNRTVLGPHWPQWDKARFSEVTKFMTDYLRTAYTPQECAQSALNATPDFSGATYTMHNAPDDESDSSSSSDSDSSDSDSDEELDEDEDLEEETQRRPRKKRKVSAKTKAVTMSGSAAIPEGDAVPTADDDITGTAPAPDADLGGRTERFFDGPYLGYHISEEERQGNIKRNKALLAQLMNDVTPDLDALKDGMKTSGPSSQGKHANKSKSTTTPRRRAAPVPRQRKSSRLANTNTTVVGAASPPPPSASPPASASSLPASVSPPPASASPPASTSPPRTVPPADSPAVPTTDSAVAEPTSLPGDTIKPVTDSTAPASIALPPLSQAAHAAVSNVPPPRATRSTVVQPAYPPNAPPWFTDNYAAMTKIDLGCHFQALVAVWTRIEAASRFEHSSANLSAKSRPKPVGAWISSNRRTEPVVGNPAEYAAQWQHWWDSLQPSWRGKDARGVWIVSDSYGGGGKEWGPLYRWGVNGVLSIVASLYFWGGAVRFQTENLRIWESAVHDVIWMLEGMALYYEMFKGKF
ncbi:hypothetical protein R3P38DRAFT_3277582 [Favolaschia claudopus]|uniref:Uncharacterized protein n=1 Tax=Favolaschia claudopus TaxID=2862362 RepID=A0AAW0AKN7_9AGAR